MSLHVKSNLNFYNKLDLIFKRYECLEEEDGNCFEFSYTETLYMMIILYLWSLGGEEIHISIMKTFKQ